MKELLDGAGLCAVLHGDVGGPSGRARESLEKLPGGLTPLDYGTSLGVALARKWARKARGESSLVVTPEMFASSQNNDDADDDDDNDDDE